MDIIKKNLVSVILGVIALVAIAANFYPFGGYFADLQADLDKRSAQFKKAKDVFSKRHTLPLPDSDAVNAPAKELGVFPEPKITTDAKALMASLVKESKGVYDAAVQMNKAECALHPEAANNDAMLLLVPGSLPNPAGSLNDEFKKQLPGEIERMRTQILNGGFPASTEELTAATTELHDRFQKKLIVGGDGQPINAADVADAEAKELALLPQRLRDAVAKAHTIYVDPTAIVLPPDFYPTVATPPTPEKIFYAQAMLWAEIDVCRAIAEVNAVATAGVSTSPVKRLLHLDVAYGGAMYLRPPADAAAGGVGDAGMGGGFGRGGGIGMATGSGVPSNKQPPLPSEKQDYSVTPTGRTSNALYDVVNVQLDVHVDATKIPVLLAALSRNRMVTVRNVNFSRVDNVDMLNTGGFDYGTAPVADLVLDVEQLQMREWTVPYMPPSVRAITGAVEAVVTPGGGTTASPAAVPSTPAAVTPAVTAPPPPSPGNRRPGR